MSIYIFDVYSDIAVIDTYFSSNILVNTNLCDESVAFLFDGVSEILTENTLSIWIFVLNKYISVIKKKQKF